MKKTLSKIINKIYDGDNDIVDVFEMRYLPRWGVLFIDVCILLFSLFIIEQIGVYFTGTMDFYKKCSLIVGVNVFFMIIFRTYSGIVRHSTFIDLSKIFLSIVYTIFVLVILNVVVYWRMDYKLFKTSLLLVYAGFSFVLLFIYRLFVKEFFNFIREYRKNFQKKRILVLGIDEVSVSLAKIIADNSSVPYHLVGFITERTDSKQASLLNRKIYTKNDIEEYRVHIEDYSRGKQLLWFLKEFILSVENKRGGILQRQFFIEDRNIMTVFTNCADTPECLNDYLKRKCCLTFN